jgi:large subunit ribosomal protein L12
LEYVYAALILHRLGKKVDEESIKKIIAAAGVQPDEIKVKALVAALSEINIDEALKSAVAMPAQQQAAPAAAAPAKKEEKKEEMKEEKKEEEALEGLAALFG